MVTLHEYDGFGRESKVWLPTPSSANGEWVEAGTLKTGAITVYGDNQPYGHYSYDQSPQGRLTEEYKAGAAWSTHPKTIQHDYNYSYGSVYRNPQACLSLLGYSDGTMLYLSYAASCNYSIVQTTDEDGKQLYEFYDKKDRLILSRQMDGNTQYATYYVYNVEGKLAYILPPMAVEGLRGDMGMVGDTLNCLQQYAYIYRYDKRGNLKYKKLLGCEPIYYVYDKGDRLIFTQNGEQRSRGEWSFTFPDAFGRVVLEGTCTASLNYNNNPLTETVVNATRTNATDANKGYSISGISVTNMQIHRVNYYDNYAFIGQNSVPTTLAYSTPDTGYGTRYENHYKGLLTGSIIARWENGAVSGYDYAAYYYDQQGRVVQEKRTNHLGGLETKQHAYDRLGNPLKKKHVHTASGKRDIKEELIYTYDHAARLTKLGYNLQKINHSSHLTLATYSYDEFCRLSNKKLQDSSNSNNKLSYSYNLHGWMTGISNPHFAQTLTYNNGTTGFNGNITAMNWTVNSQSHAYSFTYDGLNRMLNATHGSSQYTEKVTGYDKNGNILGLQRYGQTGASSYGLVDNLTYTYNGNKLTRVDDAVTATSYTGGTNFINGASTSNEYVYDQNGNLTKDLNKNITNIQYNSLNLPSVVTFSDGSTIRYMYSADGIKLRTTHVINGTTTTTDYCGNVIYENGTAKRLLHDEGYVDLSNNTYYYYLKDHQGNNRVVINSSGAVQETNHYYPFGGLFATSTNVQPYKYNGKELDTKGGLNLYDYGARHYDAALGRFTTVDPKAEDLSKWSMYSYCYDNPIKFVDPDGKRGRPTQRPIRRGLRNGGRPTSIYGFFNLPKPQSTQTVTTYRYRGGMLREQMALGEQNYLPSIQTFGGNHIQSNEKSNYGLLGAGMAELIEAWDAIPDAPSFNFVTTKRYADDGRIMVETDIIFNDPILSIMQANYDAAYRTLNDSLGEIDIKGKNIMEIIQLLDERRDLIINQIGLSPKELLMNELMYNGGNFQVQSTHSFVLPEFRQGY